MLGFPLPDRQDPRYQPDYRFYEMEAERPEIHSDEEEFEYPPMTKEPWIIEDGGMVFSRGSSFGGVVLPENPEQKAERLRKREEKHANWAAVRSRKKESFRKLADEKAEERYQNDVKKAEQSTILIHGMREMLAGSSELQSYADKEPPKVAGPSPQQYFRLMERIRDTMGGEEVALLNQCIGYILQISEDERGKLVAKLKEAEIAKKVYKESSLGAREKAIADKEAELRRREKELNAQKRRQDAKEDGIIASQADLRRSPANLERLQTTLTETEDLLGATRAWIRENYYKGGKPQEVPLELGLFSARELKAGPHIALKVVADFVETVDAGMMQDPYVLPRLHRPQNLITPTGPLVIKDIDPSRAEAAAPPEAPLYSETAPDPAKGVAGNFKLSYEALTDENKQTVVAKLKDYVDAPKDIKVAGTTIYVKKSSSSKRPVPATIIKEMTVSGAPPKLQKIETGKGKSTDPAWEQIVRRF